jgi:hypothetical protein
MRPLVSSWLDEVELELSRHVDRSALLAEAELWIADEREKGCEAFFAPVSASASDRWPILSAWHWLVSMPERELIYDADTNGHSAEGVRQEYSMDLGYRALLPRRLGKLLCSLAHRSPSSHVPAPAEDLAEEAVEEFATAREPGLAAEEAARCSLRKRQVLPAVQVTCLLILGLRKIRAEYALRVDAFCQLLRARFEERREAAVPGAGAATLAGRLRSWSESTAGRPVIRQLRWFAPTLSC